MVRVDRVTSRSATSTASSVSLPRSARIRAVQEFVAHKGHLFVRNLCTVYSIL